jgi:hypothetical protein
MKKILITLIIGLSLAGISNATLWEYYNGNLPSISDRASLALQCGISDYRGTYDQNIKIESCLRNNGDMTAELGAALASSDLTQIVADFKTSLAAKLSVGGTSLTLQGSTDDDGVTLASGKYSFTIDGSSAQKEYVICDLNPTTKVCSNVVNISRQGVRTTGAVREHRVGASVTITDYTAIKYHNDILEGISSTTGGLLLGNGKISGLYNLDGTFTWLKYNTSTSEIQWSNNGADYYNFTSSSITQLTASTTAGIGVTDSKIYVKASSTLGGAFDASGNYYQKVLSDGGIKTDSNGHYIDYTRSNTWTGTNTFNGTTTFNATTTHSQLSTSLFYSTSTSVNGSFLYSVTLNHNLGFIPSIITSQTIFSYDVQSGICNGILSSGYNTLTNQKSISNTRTAATSYVNTSSTSAIMSIAGNATSFKYTVTDLTSTTMTILVNATSSNAAVSYLDTIFAFE